MNRKTNSGGRMLQLLLALCGVVVGLWWHTALTLAAPALAPVAQTQVSGKITADTTWTKAQSPYEVTGLLTVNKGVTLTLEPGVVVQVAEHTHFIVNGGLIAVGTAQDPIIFRGATPQSGWWYGIEVGYTAEEPAYVEFDHVIVRHSGYSSLPDDGGLSLTVARARIRNTRFEDNGSNGLTIMMWSPDVEVDTVVFERNQLAAVRVTNGTHMPVLKNLSGSDNGRNAVELASLNREEGEVHLTKMGLPYVLKGGFMMKGGTRLLVDPGVEIAVDTGFYIYGEMDARGTAEQPIRIGGLEDTPGSWWGISVSGDFDAPAKVHLEHVVLEHGGQTQWDDTASLSMSLAHVTLYDVTLREGGGHGIMDTGGAPDTPSTLVISNTAILDHAGDAVICDDESCLHTIHSLTATGNGRNGLVYRMGLSIDTTWRNVGLPYYLQGHTGIHAGTLTIEPGTELRFVQDSVFTVYGHLIAQGTADAPIRFVGTESTPGWWQGIRVYDGAQVELGHCEIGYGGTANQGMLDIYTGVTAVSQCRLHHSLNAAISVGGNASPILLRNRFEDNATGVVNNNGGMQPQVVDARHNWWGHPDGPTHASNPGGQGQSVSDRVLFDPWLRSPDDVGGGNALEVRIAGVGRYSPGDSVQYGLAWSNPTGETVHNAVLRFILPAHARYVNSTGGGRFWPEQREVFWQLGTLAPGASGLQAVRLDYGWGLPDGMRTAMVAQIAGDGVEDALFDLAFYQSFSPRVETGRVDLTPVQAQELRAANAALATLWQQAEAAGYHYGNAITRSYSNGESAVEIYLIRRVERQGSQDLELYLLYPQNQNAVGLAIDGSSVTVYKPGKALRFSTQDRSWQELAATEMMGAEMMGAGMAAVPGFSEIAAGQTIGWSQCMTNCIEDKLPGETVDALISAWSTVKKAVDCVKTVRGDDTAILGCSKVIESAVPVYGIGVELGLCNVDCEKCEKAGKGCEDDNCHCCTKDSFRCNSDDWLYGTFGIDVIMRRQCRDGMYLAEVVHQVCALCDKCVSNGGNPICTTKNRMAGIVADAWGLQLPAALTTPAPVASPAHAEMILLSSGSDQECEECLRAKDPNEIIGPAGDLLPGQRVTYVLNYENVGSGVAFDVFIENPLSEHFDLATLEMEDVDGEPVTYSLSPATRLLFVEVGNLMPTGIPGATGTVTYSVQLKEGLPSGTVIANAAVVHFPSVPEETPTNTAVNVIQPLRATPQVVEAIAGQPLALTLHGVDAAGAPLTYAVTEGPRYGTLSGTPPALVYTPAADFAGLERLYFTVDNGTMTSRPAEIRVEVLPDPTDVTGPVVLWTAPAPNGAVSTSAVMGSTPEGMLYGPYIQIQFSEALDASTVNTTTVKVQTASGQTVPVSVVYAAESDQVGILLREQGQVGVTYRVSVEPGITDLRGNGMAGPHSWQFRIGETFAPASGLYMPTLQR